MNLKQNFLLEETVTNLFDRSACQVSLVEIEQNPLLGKVKETGLGYELVFFP